MATDLLTQAAVGATTNEADAMPHRLLFAPFAPIFAVFGAALTGVCTLVGSTVEHGYSLLAVTTEAPISAGSWAGLLMAVGAAIVSVYEGLRQKKRVQDTEDRAVWRAELMQADEDRAALRSEVNRLNAQIAELLRDVKHGNHMGKAVAEQVKGTVEGLKATAESTNRKVARVAEALSGSGIDVTATDPDMAALPVTPAPPEPKPKASK